MMSLFMGATAMAMRQEDRGNGAMAMAAFNQSIAMGHWGTTGAGATGAMAMGQRQRSIIPIAMIDCLDVGGAGVGVGDFYSVFYSKR
jgi:hypothetical protein